MDSYNCPTGILVDFNSSESSKNDFSLSDIITLSEYGEASMNNISELELEISRSNDLELISSDTNELATTHKLNYDNQSEDNIENEVLDFELAGLSDILEESFLDEISLPVFKPVFSWNSEIEKESKKMIHRLSLSSSSVETHNTGSTFTISSYKSSVSDGDSVFDSPSMFSLTPRRNSKCRTDSSDKENNRNIANTSQRATKLSSFKSSSSDSSGSVFLLVNQDEIHFNSPEVLKVTNGQKSITQSLDISKEEETKIESSTIDIEDKNNRKLTYTVGFDDESKKSSHDIPSSNLKNLLATNEDEKTSRKLTYTVESDEDQRKRSLLNLNTVQATNTDENNTRKFTYSVESDPEQNKIINTKPSAHQALDNGSCIVKSDLIGERSRHISGPSNLSASVREDISKTNQLTKSKSFAGIQRPKIASLGSSLAQRTKHPIASSNAVPPHTKQSLQTTRAMCGIKRSNTSVTTSTYKVKSGPVKANQMFPAPLKTDSIKKAPNPPRMSLQVPTTPAKVRIPSPSTSPRPVTPRKTLGTLQKGIPTPITPGRRSMIVPPSSLTPRKSEFALPATPSRRSLLPNKSSTPGRWSLPASSLKPSSSKNLNATGVTPIENKKISRLPSPYGIRQK